MNYEELLQGLADLEQRLRSEESVLRMQELADIKPSTIEDKFCIKITVESSESILLTEHETYTRFKNSTDRYRKDAAQPHMLAQAHYHIVPRNSNIDIYSVNMDGTAHHRDNRGFVVPKKQADELRALGVDIPKNRILENLVFQSVSDFDDKLTVYLVFRVSTIVE